MLEPMDIAPGSPASRTTQSLRAPACPSVLRDAFERAGWTVGSSRDGLPAGVTYGFIAKRNMTGRASPATALVYGFHGRREVRLADLWSLIAELNTIRADVATICLGDGATISPQAAETAALLKLRVLRVAA
jgi:hypothetical protein